MHGFRSADRRWRSPATTYRSPPHIDICPAQRPRDPHPSTYGGEIAAAKARASAGTTTWWTKDTFLDTIGSDTDRASAEKLFALLDQVDDRRGTHDDL